MPCSPFFATVTGQLCGLKKIMESDAVYHDDAEKLRQRIFAHINRLERTIAYIDTHRWSCRLCEVSTRDASGTAIQDGPLRQNKPSDVVSRVS